tara:strand:+ start:1273 stop:1464 length:192 start_codon:yes stop_codon:yes gene_type:complete
MKVIYKGASEKQIAWGSNNDPRNTLEEDKVYEVEDKEIYTWHTKIKLVDVEGWFNSISFDYVK